MNKITIKTDDQQNLVLDKKNPANDDDLYSASLLEQINIAKSKKNWKLAFFLLFRMLLFFLLFFTSISKMILFRTTH